MKDSTPAKADYRGILDGISGPSADGTDGEMWDQFLDAMRMNRLMAAAEEVGVEAAREVLLAAGLIEDGPAAVGPLSGE